MPAALWTWVISSASSKLGGGRIAGQPAREHRLAGAGRADHQQVVPARGRDLERALGVLLPADVREIGRLRRRLVRVRRGRLGRLGRPAAVKQVGEADSVGIALTSMPSTSAASGAFPSGTSSRR